jgi:cyclophilin family peptidyl-prolyl cis-trans isomerase
VRYLALPLALFVLVGCGSSASSPPPTPQPSPTPTHPPIPGAKFKNYPPMTINKNHRYVATIVTSDGTFRVKLLPKIAPLAVNNFVFLVKHHYYKHVYFHRIIQGFMIQTGDPTGTGFGGPGYVFKDELHPHMKYPIGTVAMANSGRGSNGSQFFIVSGPQGETLQPNYTIFGEVKNNLNVIFKISRTPVTTNPGSGEASQPLVKVYIKQIKIREFPH